jgi:hypothetical protein
MTKLEELWAGYEAAYETAAYAVEAADDACVAAEAACDASDVARAAYEAELERTQEENSND